MMSKILKLNLHKVSNIVLTETAKVVLNGGVILYPTDTIYGFGCDAMNGKAIEKIFEIKGRSPSSPALVLTHSLKMVKQLVEDIPAPALVLMKHFWPGQLTIIFNARKHLHPLLTSKKGRVGVRIPNNDFCLKLIAKCHTPIVSTSANISGRQMVGKVEFLKTMFQEEIDLLIDAGDLQSSLPSTVVDVTGDKLLIIREGAIGISKISAYVDIDS